MKKLLLLFFLMPSLTVFSQSTIDQYIRLDIRYYVEDGERYLGTSPELVTAGNDALSEALRKYPRRFRYILLNKTRFAGIYEKYYPDTLKINRLFTDSLLLNRGFMRVFGQLSAPFTGKAIAPVKFSRKDLLQVAARFFYCESIRQDGSIHSTICVGRNGLAGLNLAADQALLEAFCFEAIFEKYYIDSDRKNPFIDHFLEFIKEGQKKYEHLSGNREDYLMRVRKYCFAKMETDQALSDALMGYYEANRLSFSFSVGY